MSEYNYSEYAITEGIALWSEAVKDNSVEVSLSLGEITLEFSYCDVHSSYELIVQYTNGTMTTTIGLDMHVTSPAQIVRVIDSVLCMNTLMNAYADRLEQVFHKHNPLNN